jgi:hypothetical protein
MGLAYGRKPTSSFVWSCRRFEVQNWNKDLIHSIITEKQFVGTPSRGIGHEKHMTMMTTILQVYLVAISFLLGTRQSTAAFNNAPLSIQEELGCSPTLSFLLQREKDDIYFDPLSLATDENFARYREAELKHGRVAMVSVVASVASSISKKDNIVDVASYVTKGIPVPSLYQLLHEWTLSDLAKFVFVCGFLETIIFIQLLGMRIGKWTLGHDGHALLCMARYSRGTLLSRGLGRDGCQRHGTTTMKREGWHHRWDGWNFRFCYKRSRE